MNKFKLNSKYKPAGDQVNAISTLVSGINAGIEHQTLLGVTGSGKTFTMANIIEQVQKPTLVLAHNKTLAAQLYSEFKTLFPDNAVRYFVSYYDYYQPEAYVPRRDLYIEKEVDINDTIERYRNASTQSLLTRKDTMIIASVSCIYGLGSPGDYMDLARNVEVGKDYTREKLLRHLSDMQYERSEYDFYPGLYRVRGDTVDIYLTYDEFAIRIEYFGDTIESIKIINPISGEIIESIEQYKIFPAKQFVTPYEKLLDILPKIKSDLEKEVAAFKAMGKDLEAHRLNQRVNFDIEILRETGYCPGIENYSRYVEKRQPGSAPSTLLDYLPDDWLLFVDESHISVSQVRGMYNGDQARKQTLVDYGFRLQAAMDNRPLKFEEFQSKLDQTIYVSATPKEYEINMSKSSSSKVLENNNISDLPDKYLGIVEQIIRPTGLLDPIIDIRPSEKRVSEKLKQSLLENNYNHMSILSEGREVDNQIDDLLEEIKKRTKINQRVIITTLTKRMAEDLTNFLKEIDIKVQYIHSDLDTIKRVGVLKDLRLGKYDVIVGINLLREGLDLPEVSLVAILDADKEGFLRSDTSLIQTIGRAARHESGEVIMYAEKVTRSMKYAIDETIRRRKIQNDHNIKNNITPKTISKDIVDILEKSEEDSTEKEPHEVDMIKKSESFPVMSKKEQKIFLKDLETEMNIKADMLEFELAAEYRDLLKSLKSRT